MSARELVVLGTASQVPTRTRNHNGYLLRWDDEGILFDPGEGTQRQLTLAGEPASRITRICLTHAHGDHCLGLPGVLQRLALDGASGPVDVAYPEAATPYVDALRLLGGAGAEGVRLHPVGAVGGPVLSAPGFTVQARALDHRVPAVGYRVQEPDGRRMLPERLAAYGVAGPDVGRLHRAGHLDRPGRPSVRLADVSVPRPGQAVAVVMDTRWCAGALDLAAGVDLLVCESTFLDADADLADDYGHLTAAQAGRLAVEAGARRLVLTHFSRRYGEDVTPFEAEARAVFPDTVAARDLDRIPLPAQADATARRTAGAG